MTKSIKMAGVLVVGGVLMATSVYAATPTLSLVNVGGDSVQVSVVGDSNSTVTLYYNGGAQSAPIGTTNGGGAFSNTITSSAYGISAGTMVYVVVNGQQSPSQMWPYSSSSGGGVPSLSQTNVTVGQGQTVIVTSQNGAVYLGSNSSPSVASVMTNGTQVTVTGNQLGTTSASICLVNTASNCTTLTVTVQTLSASQLTFSQTNVSLTSGNSQAVLIYGGNGTYNVTMNSNTGAVSTSLSGGTLTLYGLAASGSATINICDSVGVCGYVYATVGSSSGQSVIFSPSNPTVSVGQMTYVTLSGSTSYYISSNGNSNVAQASLTGSTLTITGIASGSDTITICPATGSCNALYISVGSTGSSAVIFSPSSPTLVVGQTTYVTASNGSNFYISSNPYPGIAQASVSGSSITLYGAAAGSDSISICSGTGGCSTLYVTVSGSGTTVNSGNIAAQIQALQTQLVQILSQIQSIQTQLTQLAAQAGVTTSGNSGSTVSAGAYRFTGFLTIGSEGAEVTALQQRLAEEGYFTASATGYFGPATEAAVRAYQRAHNISPAGYVGPSTRAALNGQ
ncbi:MAG TPA: peptidoglycan-binding domain-containing protein [Candidatus Paceibacterota bacterium]|nr:peptidoglycan-binding domain-containing protein [Candidatus Paceibacterota bacterium]